MKSEYTATEIANVLCEAENLELANHAQIHNRLKYIAKRGILTVSRELDKRGTLAFAPLEIYRAAVLCELIGLAIDTRTLAVVLESAARHFPLVAEAPSLRKDGYNLSRGGLRDAVNGAAQGEAWFLKIWRVNPSREEGEGVRAEFVYQDVPICKLEGDAELAAIRGRKPSRTFVSVDLSALFTPIIKLVGVPD